MSNPYIYRGPVRSAEMFFGRNHELREIVAFLNGNQSVSIVGPRKIGKTSLLFHLQRRETWPELGLEAATLLVYLDCEVLGSAAHEEIFAAFAAEIAAALDERGLPAEAELQAAMDRPSRLAFERAIRKLNQRGLRVVLVLDEFERLGTNASLDVNFFNALRSAAGRYQLAFITASARPLIQLTYMGRAQEILSSPFFNIFAPLQLGLLPKDEARQAIAGPAERSWVGFPPAVEDLIYELVGGFPLGIQVAGFHAWEVLHNNPTPQMGEIERRSMQELAPHFEYYWRNLSPAEQDALRRIHDLAPQAGRDTTLRTLLRDLVQKCLLEQEAGAYRYPGRLWAAFIGGQSMPPAPALQAGGSLTGAQLGPYQVLELVGRGGMAEVYKGRHARLGRTVAIKVLPARAAADEHTAQFAQRFEREARAVASLRHPNIVEVFDFGDVNGTYYMVMEFVSGADLGRRLHQQGC
ncbi:MAG: protein kinase domain-containing protein, partial [Chloroflexota bacterium]